MMGLGIKQDFLFKWDQTRFFIQDANNSSSRLTLHVKGNNGATEILAATSAGSVGIGTSEPTAQYDRTIHIEGANPTFRAETNASAGWAYNQYVSPETTWSVGIDHNDKYIIANSATLNSNIKFVIDDANGNVGIGTTAPEQPFHLAATNYKPALIQRTAGTNCYLLLEDQNTTQDVGVGATTNDLKFRAGNVDYMALNSVGVLNVGTEAVTDTKLFVTGARSDSLARFKDGSDGVEITTRGVSRQQIDFLGSNTSAINAKGSLHINYDSDNNGSNDSIHFTRNGADEAGTVDMVIKEGQVGIGTSSPSYELDVNGTTRSTYYVGGAYLEENASSSKLKFYKDGTVLVIDEDGKLKPCEKENDTLVFGVSKIDFDSPVVLGAEPILITGPIKIGDYIVTSSKQGHGQAMKEQKLGTIIAQAMENGDGESYNIKAMIRKM
jgi:hypothetical protein